MFLSLQSSALNEQNVKDRYKSLKKSKKVPYAAYIVSYPDSIWRDKTNHSSLSAKSKNSLNLSSGKHA